MNWLKSAFLAVLLAVVFIASCRRDDPSWDLDLSLPVAHGSFTIDNLIDDSLTSAGPDGALRITFHTAVPGISADSLFNIPDTTILNSYNWPIGSGNLFPGQVLVNNTPTQTLFDLSPAQLIYGIFEKGKAVVHMQNDIQKRVIVTYELSSATIGGNPAIVTDTLPAAPSATQGSVVDKEIDLAGYEIDFTGLLGDRVNTVVTRFTVMIDPSEVGTVTVVPADSVIANITFEDVKPSYVRGYFGSEITQIGPEESYTSFFSKVQSGQLGLDSIYLTLTLENYAGMDMRFTVNNLWTRSQRLNQTMYLNHSLVGATVNINRAAYSFSYPPSIPQVYSWRFDNSNSNIVEMMEIMPDFLGYDFSIYTNPLGNVSGNNDFLYTAFGLNAYVDIDMPVNFFADQIMLVDTVDVDFGTVNPDDIRELNLTLYAGNGFPFDAGIQIYLLDEFGAIADAIVTAPGVINSAPLASSGGYFFANGATQSVITIPLNETQTSLFMNSSRVVIKPVFDTNSNPNYVKIFTTNRLDVNLVADFEYRVNN